VRVIFGEVWRGFVGVGLLGSIPRLGIEPPSVFFKGWINGFWLFHPPFIFCKKNKFKYLRQLCEIVRKKNIHLKIMVLQQKKPITARNYLKCGFFGFFLQALLLLAYRVF
jgi:hypothetical protein